MRSGAGRASAERERPAAPFTPGGRTTLAGATAASCASPVSSSRKGERRSASPSTTQRSIARVIATCSTRRSASQSSESRCGTSPSVTPKTTTRSHSRPLTRWTVERVTPSLPDDSWSEARSQGSNVSGSGWRSDTWISASRSSRWEAVAWVPFEPSSISIAPPSPIRSRMNSSSARASAPPFGLDREQRDVVGHLPHPGRDAGVVDPLADRAAGPRASGSWRTTC